MGNNLLVRERVASDGLLGAGLLAVIDEGNPLIESRLVGEVVEVELLGLGISTLGKVRT